MSTDDLTIQCPECSENGRDGLPFEIKDSFELGMPYQSRVLSVQLQNGTPTMWAVVYPDNFIEKVKFRVIGTGHTQQLRQDEMMPSYEGTFQYGPLVFHLFREEEVPF